MISAGRRKIHVQRLAQTISHPPGSTGNSGYAGCFDGFSTANVEKLGFKAGFVSGAGISESALGLADMGVMGLEDNLA